MAFPSATLDRLPLENGDRLSREEFHERYKQWPELKRAELIDGVVHLPLPVRLDHAEPHALLMAWLGAYVAKHPGLRIADNATVILPGDNEVQPDALLTRESHLELRSGYVVSPPDFVAEIAATSASYDLHDKFRLYERSGVSEYLVWVVYERRLRWFTLDSASGRYSERDADESGVVESDSFPGLRLDVPGLLRGDFAAVLAAVR
jgi:Uma2 family endonuclease